MNKDRFFDIWKSISEDPLYDASNLCDPDERTKPLGSVIKLREFATQIHLLQLRSFSVQDRQKGVVSLSIKKDQLLQLSSEIQEHFELGEFIPPDENVEVSVSARSTNLFLSIECGRKRYRCGFDPDVKFMTSYLESYEDEGWIVKEEKFLDNYQDPIVLLKLFQGQLDSVNGSYTA